MPHITKEQSSGHYWGGITNLMAAYTFYPYILYSRKVGEDKYQGGMFEISSEVEQICNNFHLQYCRS